MNEFKSPLSLKKKTQNSQIQISKTTPSSLNMLSQWIISVAMETSHIF